MMQSVTGARRARTFAGALVVCLVPGLAGASLQAPVDLLPHRAVYDLELVRSGGIRGLESAGGRIALEFTGDACRGYTMVFRQATRLQGAETGTREVGLTSRTFEAADGRSFTFETEMLAGAGSEGVAGEARRQPDGSVRVRLSRPNRDNVVLKEAPVFPTAHLKQIIEAARLGETTLSVPVFDGSETGRKVYETLAVIGRKIPPSQSEDVEDASRAESLRNLARWPVTLSYYAPGAGERTPAYVLSFQLYENGVSRALTLDYGEFALRGVLTRFEPLPRAEGCDRP